MPTYDYKCSSCGALFEHFQSMNDKPIKKCRNCGKNSAVRLIGGGSGLIFKGSGFYITDYKKKDESKRAKKDSKEPKKETANSTTSKSDSTEKASNKNE